MALVAFLISLTSKEYINMVPATINEISDEIHHQNKTKGWWDNKNQCPFEKLQLVSTEIAEATEGDRKKLMDDKLPHRKMIEVELADTIIRVLDFGGANNYKYVDPYANCEAFVFESQVFCYGTESIAAMLLALNKHLIEFADAVNYGENVMIRSRYSMLVFSLFVTSTYLNLDVLNAMYEKLEFNQKRPDHMRENRVKEGGKAY